MDFASQIEQIFPGHSRNQEAINEFEEKKWAGILTHPIFAEVVPTLKFLEERGVKRFICSSTRLDIISAYVKKYRLAGLLDDCLGYEPGFGKDRQVESILQRHRLETARVVFVGDSPRDFDSIKDKRVDFVGIRHTFDEPTFRKRGLTSVQDLAALRRMWA